MLTHGASAAAAADLLAGLYLVHGPEMDGAVASDTGLSDAMTSSDERTSAEKTRAAGDRTGGFTDGLQGEGGTKESISVLEQILGRKGGFPLSKSLASSNHFSLDGSQFRVVTNTS